ncbi:MAG: phytanoyl-CoA dioxygenase family protein [Pirellulales bacterium]|nr:phytanoyl-CoA dioxygenase family protein [Pirellulales bacterium]
MPLLPDQVTGYHATGVATPIAIASSQEVEYYRNEFDRLESEEGVQRAQNRLFDRHFDQPFIWEIASHPAILDSVAALYGEHLLVLSTHVFCKYGSNDHFVAWHQDLTYWGLEPLEEVTAWYAIDDSDLENGCMRVLPGRHPQQLLEHGRSDQAGNLLSVNQAVAVTPEDEAQAIDCVLQAGEISLHEGTVVHGSLPNRSPRRRCGVAVRYIPAHVRPLSAGPLGTDWKWRPILVRGASQHDHFDLVPPPFSASS